MDVFNFNLPGILQPQCQLIPPEGDLNGVAHGGHLLQLNLGLGGQAHIQKMMPQCAVTANTADKSRLPRF